MDYNLVVHGVGSVIMSLLDHMTVGAWKNIKRGWGMFSSHTKFEVRDGAKVRFWHDLWFGDKALRKPLQIYMVLFVQRMLQ